MGFFSTSDFFKTTTIPSTVMNRAIRVEKKDDSIKFEVTPSVKGAIAGATAGGIIAGPAGVVIGGTVGCILGPED